MEENQLPTVHHVLNESAQEPRGVGAMPTYTFRIADIDLQEAERICIQNGSTLPAFLRTCCRAVVRDYKP